MVRKKGVGFTLMNKFIKKANKLNKRLTIGAALCAYIFVGILLGYGMALSDQSDEMADTFLQAPKRMQVLGDRAAPNYVNPFKEAGAAKVNFPIARLLGCRNWTECKEYCSKPASFQECAAWERSQEQ